MDGITPAAGIRVRRETLDLIALARGCGNDPGASLGKTKHHRPAKASAAAGHDGDTPSQRPFSVPAIICSHLVSVFMLTLYEFDFAAWAEPNPLRRTQYSHTRSHARGEAAMSAVATISSSERKVTSPKRIASVCRRALTIR